MQNREENHCNPHIRLLSGSSKQLRLLIFIQCGTQTQSTIWFKLNLIYICSFFYLVSVDAFCPILTLLVNGKHIKNGGQAYGFSCNYFYEDCPLAEGIHYTGDEWKSSTRVSVFNTFEVWKYVVPFFLISFFFFYVCLDDVHTQMSMCHWRS